MRVLITVVREVFMGGSSFITTIIHLPSCHTGDSTEEEIIQQVTHHIDKMIDPGSKILSVSYCVLA